MLAFIVVICNGNFNGITYATSTMSWYEEWLFYFEFVLGKTCRRWVDAASAMNYDLDPHSLRKIFDRKLQAVLLCRKSWPIYASYKEDKTLY